MTEPTYAEIQHNLREMEAAINGHQTCAAHDRYLCADCAEMGAKVIESARERIKATHKENLTVQEVASA